MERLTILRRAQVLFLAEHHPDRIGGVGPRDSGDRIKLPVPELKIPHVAWLQADSTRKTQKIRLEADHASCAGIQDKRIESLDRRTEAQDTRTSTKGVHQGLCLTEEKIP